MECSPKEEWNPFKQDIKKGNLRFFKYGDLPFNYGFVPQTWEDPNQSSRHSDVGDLKGDNDPLDVVEISGTKIPRGQIVPIKVLSVLGLIDEGEADWKIIGIRADHPQAAQINSIKDADRVFQTDLQNVIVDWFQKYKVPDGKPENRFTHNAQFQGSEAAIDVIEDAHRQWYDLILGAVKTENSLQSLTRKRLVEQGIVRNDRMPQRPAVNYPVYENWNSKSKSQTFGNKKYHGEEEK
ncbi:inorganic pyrophosphatase-like protein [Reticulomyxa filosa]|uniref:inorganic diphosphatase n=1 Tax=Reticulomyxa filosa TaxID=46433 RepID=X6M0Y1_RETFI|nr:inorganic pyrophosphatase-like protein [Reticulomyxa filosa]|eukprot:ETO07813.1 inorganic pyrophosphatase-like protein [Reticulomyxa filosa]